MESIDQNVQIVVLLELVSSRISHYAVGAQQDAFVNDSNRVSVSGGSV